MLDSNQLSYREDDKPSADHGALSSWYVSAMERLVRVVSDLSQAHNDAAVINIVRTAARDLTGADGATLILRDGGNCHYVEENAISPLWKGHRFPMESCISGWVMMNSRPAIIEDIYSDPRIPADLYKPTFVKSLAVVPIRKDNPVGAIGNYWAKKRLPDDKEIAILEALANVTAVAMENTKLFRELEQSNRRKDEFLATLAHELRNPLAPISNVMPLLSSGTMSDAMKNQAHEIIQRQINHMVRLVDDLMDLSRINHGKIELRNERIKLVAIIDDAIEMSNPLIRENRHDLKVILPDEDIILRADRFRMAQVVSNVLNNAAKYTDPGGKITLTAVAKGGSVTVSVLDNGIGMAADVIPGIFEPFSQVKSALDRAQGGLGIGLNLVRKIIELHGGTVAIESPGIGQGTTVTMTLPVEAQTRENKPDVKAQSMDKARKLKVLIVDDNKPSVQTLGWGLELSGHTISLAFNGEDALKIADIMKPDVVLLDIGMPGMNGYDVCKALRKNPSLTESIIIAQTGWGQEEHRKLSAEAGFDHHLVKPIQLATLENMLLEI